MQTNDSQLTAAVGSCRADWSAKELGLGLKCCSFPHTGAGVSDL